MKNHDNHNRSQRQRERMKEMDGLIKGIAEGYEQNPETIAELMAFSSKFYTYSTRNISLIYNQNPYATFVQSFDKWKEAGYSVKSGEKGIRILVPVKAIYIKTEAGEVKLSQADKQTKEAYKMGHLKGETRIYFNVGTTFDISQTTCPVEEYPRFYHMGHKDEKQAALVECLIQYARECLKTDVTQEDLKSIALRGQFFPQEVEGRYRIQLNQLLNDTEKLSTLSHEIGHAIFHKDFPDTLIIQKEFEADCFSIMLENHLGIPLTDSRKDHLATHYRQIQKYNAEHEDKLNLHKLISGVYRKFETEFPWIEAFIKRDMQNIQEQELARIKETGPFVEITTDKFGLKKGDTMSVPEFHEVTKSLDIRIHNEQKQDFPALAPLYRSNLTYKLHYQEDGIHRVYEGCAQPGCGEGDFISNLESSINMALTNKELHNQAFEKFGIRDLMFHFDRNRKLKDTLLPILYDELEKSRSVVYGKEDIPSSADKEDSTEFTQPVEKGAPSITNKSLYTSFNKYVDIYQQNSGDSFIAEMDYRSSQSKEMNQTIGKLCSNIKFLEARYGTPIQDSIKKVLEELKEASLKNPDGIPEIRDFNQEAQMVMGDEMEMVP